MFSLQSLKPALLFACAGALTTAALHFPTAYHRLFLPPTLLITAWSLASIHGDATSVGPLSVDLYTGITCMVFMCILPRILFFEKYSLFGNDKASKSKKQRPAFVRPSRSSLTAAWRIWNNPRNLTFSRPGPAAAPYAWPVLMRFAIWRVLKAGSIILFHHQIVNGIQERLTASGTLFDFTPDQEPIMRRILDQNDDPISSHQLFIRAFMSVSWIWANFLILECCHALLSIVFVVVLRLDDPEDWPPLFGSITEAWTVKRFWGRFWHRIVTPSFSWCVRPIARTLCRPNSSLERALVALGIFFLSGVMHMVAAWRTGQGYAHLDLLFFTSNFVVVLFETVVSKLVGKMSRKTAFEEVLRDYRVGMVGKALGFVWVFAWFFWAVPRWIYPKILRLVIKQAILQYLPR